MGIEVVKGSYLLLVDVDLLGLLVLDIGVFIELVWLGKVDVIISLCCNVFKLWYLIGIDYIFGEWVISKDLLVD